MKEIWKDIKDYEWIYQVSNLWRVKSLARERYNWKWYYIQKERILSLWKSHNIYLRINLSKNWLLKIFAVHRLVWQAFLWLNIDDSKTFACHRDETLVNWLLDNSKDNLWLWTHLDNMKDKWRKWRSTYKWIFWIDNPFSKKVNQYNLEWWFIKLWHSIRDIERELWIANQNISKVCKWKRNHAWGFIWKYT